jgi:hypothetical protein
LHDIGEKLTKPHVIRRPLNELTGDAPAHPDCSQEERQEETFWDGVYDEQESHDSFQRALLAWRTSGQGTTAPCPKAPSSGGIQVVIPSPNRTPPASASKNIQTTSSVYRSNQALSKHASQISSNAIPLSPCLSHHHRDNDRTSDSSNTPNSLTHATSTSPQVRTHPVNVTFNKGDFKGETLSYREKLLLAHYRHKFEA